MVLGEKTEACVPVRARATSPRSPSSVEDYIHKNTCSHRGAVERSSEGCALRVRCREVEATEEGVE